MERELYSRTRPGKRERGALNMKTESGQHSARKQKRIELWCRACSTFAAEDCADAGHALCSHRKLRSEQAAPRLQQLRDAAAAARKVVWALQDARDALDVQLQEWQALLQKVEEAEKALTVAVDEGPDLEAVPKVDGLERLPDAATLLEAKCELQVQLRDRDGHEWKGDLQRAAGGGWLLNPVVLHLHQFGNIAKVKRLDPTPAARVILSSERRLDITEYVTREAHVQELEGVLQDPNLAKVRRLEGVNCSVWPIWCKLLLQRVAPHVTHLRVEFALQEHLDAICRMPALRYLDVDLKSRTLDTPDLPQQLEDLQVRNFGVHHLGSVKKMANLRKLTIWTSPFVRGQEVIFSPLPRGHRGLQWLCVALRPMSTVLSLVQLHAATLLELRILCASEGSTHLRFEDLAEGLRRCGLVALRRVVLLRGPAPGFPNGKLPHADCRPR